MATKHICISLFLFTSLTFSTSSHSPSHYLCQVPQLTERELINMALQPKVFQKYVYILANLSLRLRSRSMSRPLKGVKFNPNCKLTIEPASFIGIDARYKTLGTETEDSITCCRADTINFIFALLPKSLGLGERQPRRMCACSGV